MTLPENNIWDRNALLLIPLILFAVIIFLLLFQVICHCYTSCCVNHEEIASAQRAETLNNLISLHENQAGRRNSNRNLSREEQMILDQHLIMEMIAAEHAANFTPIPPSVCSGTGPQNDVSQPREELNGESLPKYSDLSDNVTVESSVSLPSYETSQRH